MKTLVTTANEGAARKEAVTHAAEIIRRGGVVAFPTETVYGLGADALNARAVARIFAAKGRPATNPLIVHVASVAQAKRVAAQWPRAALLLARRFWPGPLTLILPKRAIVPDIVTAGLPTVAVRCPAHPVALALIRAAGTPIAAPSANRSTQVSPTRAAHVERQLAGRIPLILDGGNTPGGIESTVLDLTGATPHVLRPGLVTATEIAAVLGTAVLTAHDQTVGGCRPRRSPGMMERHYSPRMPLVCLPGGESAAEVGRSARGGARVGWISLGKPDARRSARAAKLIAMPLAPRAYAARLYAALHEMEDAGVDRIIADLPPDTKGWVAVRDRLRRASSR